MIEFKNTIVLIREWTTSHSRQWAGARDEWLHCCIQQSRCSGRSPPWEESHCIDTWRGSCTSRPGFSTGQSSCRHWRRPTTAYHDTEPHTYWPSGEMSNSVMRAVWCFKVSTSFLSSTLQILMTLSQPPVKIRPFDSWWPYSTQVMTLAHRSRGAAHTHCER